MIGGALHQLEDLERLRESIPLGRAARRLADLQVADSGSRELCTVGHRFDRLPDDRMAQTRDNAGVKEVGQRHARSRGARSARASESRDRLTLAA